MQEKQFNVGDKVTYKSNKDCLDDNYLVGYFFGGTDQNGFTGEIIEYVTFVYDANCWEILVTNNLDFDYNMLESEFIEYKLVD